MRAQSPSSVPGTQMMVACWGCITDLALLSDLTGEKWLQWSTCALSGDGCRQSRSYKRGAYAKKLVYELEDIHTQTMFTGEAN